MSKAKGHLDRLAARRHAYQASMDAIRQGYLNYLAEHVEGILAELAELRKTHKGKAAGEVVGSKCAELGFGREGSARTVARVLNVKKALDDGVITLGELQAALRAGHGLSIIGMLLTRQGKSGERLPREKILEALKSKEAMESQLRAAGRYAREGKSETGFKGKKVARETGE